MHTNIVFQISHELKRIFKIATRLLSLRKVLLETPFSKKVRDQRPETSQSISSSNQSLFSILRSIIDLKKIHYIDFKQNKASVLLLGLGARLNFFSLQKSLFPCISKHFCQKNLKPYKFSFSLSNLMKINH